MLLCELLRSAGLFCRTKGREDIEIKGISTDSRRVRTGELFVCIRGRKYDGHRFAEEAVARGAAAIVSEDDELCVLSDVPIVYTHDTASAAARLWDAWYHHPAAGMKLVAVSGTNGKTTTCFMLDAIFSAAICRCGVIGTVYCRTPRRVLDVPPPAGGSGMTTPDPEQLYRVLSEMREDGAEYVFIEATSHALALGRLAPLKFEVAVFTNLTPEHLDFHGTMENYFLAKASLLEKCSLAVINDDDPYAVRYRAYARAHGCTCRTVFFSAKGKRSADYRAESCQLKGSHGISYTLCGKNTLRELSCPVPGHFTVENTLAASAVAYEMGISGRSVSEALSSFSGAPGRLRRVRTSPRFGASVYIDYAHTPDALESLLRTARDFTPQDSRLWVLFGCGGDRDRSKRPVMGNIASRLADFCIITSDNSRSELPEDIIGEILADFDPAVSHAVIPSRADAIAYAIENAGEGDVILLVGKGHEQYEVNRAGRREFNETKIVMNAADARIRREAVKASETKNSPNST